MNLTKSLLKGTLSFGIAQGLISLFLIARSKFIAFFLGVEGFGEFGLLNSLILFYISAAMLGVDRSVVRALVNTEFSALSIEVRIQVLNRFVPFLAIVAFGIFIVIDFGVHYYRGQSLSHSGNWFYSALVVPLMIWSSIYYSVLRALGKTKILIFSMVIGNLIGVVCSILLILLDHSVSVDLLLLSSALSNALILYLYIRRSDIWDFSSKSLFNHRERYWISKLLREGLGVVLSGFVVAGSAFYLRYFLSQENDGIVVVGLFAAAFSIVNNYFGSIFSAISMDYYPRVVTEIDNRLRYVELVNEQFRISILFILPVLFMLHVFFDPLILLLYSEDFLVIKDLLIISSSAVLLKAVTYSMGVSFMAKGDVRLLVYTEIFFNIVLVISSLVLYDQIGLIGLGFGFLISNTIQLIVTYYLCSWRYRLVVFRDNVIVFMSSVLLTLMSALFAMDLVEISLSGLILFTGSTVLFCVYRLISIFKS